jgi:hypothetical protein
MDIFPLTREANWNLIGADWVLVRTLAEALMQSRRTNADLCRGSTTLSVAQSGAANVHSTWPQLRAYSLP